MKPKPAPRAEAVLMDEAAPTRIADVHFTQGAKIELTAPVNSEVSFMLKKDLDALMRLKNRLDRRIAEIESFGGPKTGRDVIILAELKRVRSRAAR